MPPTSSTQENHFDLWLALLSLAFFLSGFSALLYQVVWQRLLGLFSGSDVRSVTIITGAYLAGLGLGSLLGSLWADRFSSRQAVQFYGLCNLAIAGFAFLSPRLYYDLLFLRLDHLAESPVILLLIVFASLLFPTTLMGLSLPFVSKAIVRQVSNAATRISRLYALNTLGAGLGTILAGWYLAGTLGYSNSVYLGGGISLVVGIMALVLARQFRANDAMPAADAAQKLSLRHLPSTIWFWSGLVFASGFIAISLEIIWFRVLSIALRANAYTFGHLLAFFLVGDALGSILGARILHRIQNPRRAFMWIQGLIALYSLLIIWGIAYLTNHSRWMEDFHLAIPQEGVISFSFSGEMQTVWMVYLLLPFFMIFIPAMLIGFYFPIVQKAVQTDGDVVGQRVGLVEVANIIGNTLGSILTGTLLLSQLGTTHTLRLIGVLGLLFMLVLLRDAFRQFTLPAKISSVGLSAALLGVIILFPGQASFWGDLHHLKEGQTFVVAEDSTGVSAIREDDIRAVFYANGLSQGELPYLSIHGFLGATPALVHPNPRRMMLIGIGSSATPYAVGVNPKTENVVLVEIIASELDVLEDYRDGRFGGPIHKMFEDPRYQIIVGDGRRELALIDEPFDIIQADAIYPSSSHSGLLYSKEFFEQAKSHLAPGGIMAQWRPTQRVEDTFVQVFPYVVNIGDALLLGSESPIDYNRDATYQRFFDPEIADYLIAGAMDPEQVGVINLFTPGEFWYPETPRPSGNINTDLFPRDEYYLNNPQRE